MDYIIVNSQLLFLVISSGILISGLVILNISIFPPHSIKGGKFWGIANILTFIGLALLGLRGEIPDFYSYVVANILILYVVQIYINSIFKAIEIRLENNILIFIIIFFSVLFLYFYWFRENFTARSVSISFGIIFQIIVALLKINKNINEYLILPIRTIKIMAGLLVISLSIYASNLLWGNQQTTVLFDGNDSILLLVSFVFVINTILSLLFVLLSNTINFQEINELVYIDPLTQAFNRRAIMDQFTSQISNSKQTKFPFSILLIDIDNLKFINDTFGHTKGDHAIKHVSHILTKTLSTNANFGRVGGDEILALLPNTNYKGADVIAQNIITALRMNPIDITIKISIGGTQFEYDDMEITEIFNRADKALYDVKRAGGNDYKCLRLNSGELSN